MSIKEKLNLSKKGFTLVEVLIVIGLIGILASIILMNISDIRGKANRAAFFQEIKSSVSYFTSQCSDVDSITAINTSNIVWTTQPSFDSCGSNGNMQFCVQGVNLKAFSETTDVGNCQVYIGQSGVFSDDTCSNLVDISAICL